ncbi:DEAD/DEAH box helicase [Roseimaritima sediminicola]|uniref:DEAD/DEAH box helicase n=1 Tax=Roseimaritima sediminicola TaxID=2662066 RepID=UPI001F481353|nr:DEAD/DEAH box helicase [Roseimaritima sediminicola]
MFPLVRNALADQDYQRPTPIQAQTIPPAIAGQDILGCAQTGTGKTAAFAIPILDYLGHDKPSRISKQPTTLILAPTRELAIQIGESFRSYGRHMRVRQALVYGGVGQQGQVEALRQGVDVLIATPGRLLDLMNQGHVDLGGVEIFVLDEADRMLDMGFWPALEKIIAALPRDRQSLFFSATLAPKIRKLAAKLLFNAVSIDVTPESSSVEGIEQTVRVVQRADKLKTLQDVLGRDGVERTIVFTRTKHGANALTKKLDRLGIAAAAIHGNKTQNARQKALEAFRQQRVTVLVATDVAARGIDIDGVTHVVNYDMPVEPESYVHRIGRTGRAGEKGIAVSFCTAEERDELRAIEKLIDQRLTLENPESKALLSDASTAAKRGAGKPSRGGPSRSRSSKRGPQARRQSGRNHKARRASGARVTV